MLTEPNMNKPRYTLVNWRMSYRRGAWVLRGTAGGGHAYDGERIHTSPIVGAKIQGESMLFETQNSLYECAFGSAQAHFRGRLENLPDIPGVEVTAEEVRTAMSLIEELDAARTAAEVNRLAALLPEGVRKAVVVEFDDRTKYYFSGMIVPSEGGWELFGRGTEYVHVGNFQDSVILGEFEFGEGPELRYFPYKSNRLEFYVWVNLGLPVYVANSAGSGAAIEVDTPEGMYLLPPGTSCEAKRNADSEYHIPAPTVPPIDKYSLYEARPIEGADAVAYSRPSGDWPNQDEGSTS